MVTGRGRVSLPTRIAQGFLCDSTFDLFAIVKQIVDTKAQFRSLAESWADTATSQCGCVRSAETFNWTQAASIGGVRRAKGPGSRAFGRSLMCALRRSLSATERPKPSLAGRLVFPAFGA